MLSHTRRRTLRLTSTLVAAGMLAAACGGADEAPDAPDAPVEEPEAGDDAAAEDLRIVSLSPTSTEVLFAIGAGDQVVAVDDQSSFPEDAPVTDLSGFNPNLEAIAAFEPDVVFLSNDTDGLVDGLTALDIEVVLHGAATDLDEAFDQMRNAGEVTGNADQAEALVDDLRAELDTLLADAPDASGLSYYHELDPTFFSVTSSTFIGQVYGLFGLDNVADAAGDDAPFPQLSPEFLIDADPDLIFATTAPGETADDISARPGWDTISAVEQGRITVLDTDVASRWGPRVVEFAQVIADVLEDVA